MKNNVIIVGAGHHEITHLLTERFSKMHPEIEIVSVTENVTNNHEVKEMLRQINPVPVIPYQMTKTDFPETVLFDKPKSKFHK